MEYIYVVMIQMSGERIQPIDEQATQRMVDFVDYIHDQTITPNPGNPSEPTKALYAAVDEKLKDSDFSDVCRYLLTTYEDDEPNLLADKLYKTLVYIAAPSAEEMPLRDALYYLADMDNVDDWCRVIDRVVEDEELQERFITHMVIPIASNISERGELLEATALLHGMTHPNNVVEFGSSLELILKRLVLRGSDPGLRYDLTFVHDRPPRKREDARMTVNPELTRNYDRAMRLSSFVVRHATAVDAFDYRRDPAMRRWAAINSWYLGEISNEVRVDRFFSLMEREVPEIDFLSEDAASLEPGQTGELADITYLPTMIYQLKKDVVKAVLASAENCTAENGLVIVQDKVRMNPKRGPYFFRRWDWNYRVWVKNMAAPDKGWQNYFTADGGRVNSIVIEPAAKVAPYAEELGLV